LKIAMIGAGSIGFTRRLMQDILAVPELQETHFALVDVSKRQLDMVARLCERDVKGNNLPAKVSATLDRRRAVADADYVICTIRQGGLEAFQSDIDVPLRYGVDQCVGDTLCAGGIMYAQRTIPALLDFCRDIREVAKPGALFLNYSNPMAMNTWACNQYGGVQTVGLCHGVQGAHHQIARAIEEWARREKLIRADEKVTKNDVDVVAAGLNHQTWFVKIQWRGRDMVPTLYEMMSAVPEFRENEKIRLDVLKRFGFYSTESNGHLSEYLPWYRKRPKRDQGLDQPQQLDQRRDRRLPARLHRGPQLVRDRLPQLAQRAGPEDRPRPTLRRARQLHHRGPRDRPPVPRAL
jgi:alpha-galactosidase